MRFCRCAFAALLWSGLTLGPLEAQQYVISTLAGGAPFPTPVPALKMPFGYPGGIAVDAGGNVYFSSQFSVFKMDTTGTVTRIAGNGRSGYSGDGGPSLDATMNPGALALDGAGNLYAMDGSTRVRRISPRGIITTVAGLNQYHHGGPAENLGRKLTP
jgi:sugar lactone lactonase YvrE